MQHGLFIDKKIAVLGLSTEGQDTIKFFLQEGANVSGRDRRNADDLGETYASLLRLGVDLQLGTKYLKNLEDFDLIVRTPGMALWLPELQEAYAEGITITSQTKLFFDLCPCPIVGVTGTKGKGTTTTLIGEILKASGITAYVGGNVGKPLLSQVNLMMPKDIVVLELSSFQLEDLHKSPHVAVVLNVTQDHLANADPLSTNFHHSRKEYIDAKLNIVNFQKKDDYLVVNADYETSRLFIQHTKAVVYEFSRWKETEGVFVKNNDLIIRFMMGKHEVICRTQELQLRGSHNWENITAAIVSATLVGAKLDAIKRIVPAFRGLEHRLEFVAKKIGVAYYNDSFSTTPETAIAAIKAFTEPIILIAGGSEKGSDYSELGRTIKESKVKALLLIGETAPKIEKAIVEQGGNQNKQIIRNLTNMEEIVKAAQSLTRPGDVVLLSPACASFGMFKNYKERGQLFKRYVKEI